MICHYWSGPGKFLPPKNHRKPGLGAAGYGSLMVQNGWQLYWAFYNSIGCFLYCSHA